MTANTLFLLSESIVTASFWNSQTIRAIRRQAAYKRLPVKNVSLEELIQGKVDRNSVLTVVGGTISWHRNVLDLCFRQGIRPLFLAGTQDVFSSKASLIAPDQYLMCESVLRYCMSVGRRKVAFFANNPRSMTDRAKVNYLLESARYLNLPFSAEDVFHNNADLKKCTEEFAEKAHLYDVVISANDAAAAVMVTDPAFRARVRIPEDLYLITLGTSCLARLTKPSLTGIGLDYHQLGVVAVENVLYLNQHPEVSAQKTLLRPTFYLGASTENAAFDLNPANAYQPAAQTVAPEEYSHSFYADAIVAEFQRIETELNNADALERKILAAILRQEHMADTIDKCFISESTYKYRVRSICRVLGTENRSQIRETLNRWIDREAFLRWAEGGQVTEK
ncbi:MAG: substrate-binding domain-containing protein [Clostridia bacterium]|nr:substrate-binding domain-containing protein [Clostridia bacterium]